MVREFFARDGRAEPAREARCVVTELSKTIAIFIYGSEIICLLGKINKIIASNLQMVSTSEKSRKC